MPVEVMFSLGLMRFGEIVSLALVVSLGRSTHARATPSWSWVPSRLDALMESILMLLFPPAVSQSEGRTMDDQLQ